MSRCGCAGICSCRFQAGRGVDLEGQGTKAHPVTVILDGAQAYIQGDASETIAVSVVGAGTPDDPYVVTMDEFTGVRRPVTYVFRAAGTYTWAKPLFGTFARVTVVGGGGGGAAGGSAGTTSSLWHDAGLALGGDGGGVVQGELLLADVGTTTTVTVGAGGSGGVPLPTVPTLPQAAAAGTVGGPTSFGTMLAAPGGAGGLTANQEYADTRPTSAVGGGGAGGMSFDGTPEGPREGKAGGAGYPWSAAVGGAGGNQAGTTVIDGGDSPMALSPRGTGGGGGYGSMASLLGNAAAPGTGGSGGSGAGGGGGGIGTQYGAPGGRGGDGIVLIVIQ